jgi:hypothetical protein
MAEFQLDMGSSEGAKRFSELDAFTRGYIEAAFWCGETEEGELDDKTFEDLAPESLAAMIEDCEGFQVAFADNLVRVAEIAGDYDAHRAGVDFWLTRNHHGAGFWDRGLGKVGDELTKDAHPYGEAYLYVGDNGLVYCS